MHGLRWRVLQDGGHSTWPVDIGEIGAELYPPAAANGFHWVEITSFLELWAPIYRWFSKAYLVVIVLTYVPNFGMIEFCMRLLGSSTSRIL